ncbi:hypothetical protein SLEP1_g17683 [Rubroshorea leprosula]|uniref:Uncharacterized protein n=1 Tax=Rubroshorea leprosula TaxID=152421 RepID=A0AAV5J4A0_9ROSI|nr:hypothetical protein SLEP1_g17683 [Rubroshorea leprosula]
MRSKELWNLEMNIQARIGGLICPRFCLKTDKFISSYSKSALNIFCSRRDPSNQKDGESNGDKSTTDWDKAWSNFRKQGKKSFFSRFSPNKYVSWNPRQSNYPLSEEVDPIKRTERSNLRLWTSPEFTLGGAIVIVTFLLVYSILALN